jgi:MFS family permease
VPPLLRETQFRRFWIGQTISVVGDQISALALPLVAVLTLHVDPAQMGLLTAATLLPHLLFSLAFGVLLDRVRSRRRVMIAADLARAVVVASIPLAYLLDVLRIEHLFVAGFLIGTLTVLFDLSWSVVFVAIAPRERYVEGSALLNGSRSLSYVAGPTIGGTLVQVLGAPITMIADAASFVASALFLGRVQAPEAPIEPEAGTLRERFAAGMAFIFRDRIMRAVLLSAATINFFNFGFSALFVLYATRELGVSPGILGAVLGVGAIGGLLGAAIATRVGRRIGVGPAYALGCILFPAPLILVPLAGGPPALILAALFLAEFGAGLGVMILDINVGSVMLARTPDRIRSRAMGAFRTVNYGIRPVGAALGGLLASAIGVRETLFIVTIAPLLGILWLLWSPVIRLRDLPDAAAEG